MDITSLDIKTHILNHLNSKSKINLKNYKSLNGNGVYLIYCKKKLNYNHNNTLKPIYVGKAMPMGSRKGSIVDINKQKYKYGLKPRLSNHYKSICLAKNLDINDFYVVVINDLNPYLISVAEYIFIEEFNPVWNTKLDGFGNKSLGRNRSSQILSKWDQMHPGRLLT